jgi:GntR family transcriptional regulator, gluconate operon transcriptional repressor
MIYQLLEDALSVIDLPSTNSYHIARESLKDQAWIILRDLIVKGNITPGQKLTERDVAKLLGVGRMPAREALMKLEEQGLVVTKPDARYVIELSQKDIEDWFEIRQALEVLAVQNAVMRRSEADCNQLTAALESMRSAVAQHEAETYVQSDLTIHELIWSMSGNRNLISMLHTMIGPIFMLISSQTHIQHDWDAVFQLHSVLVDKICFGDAPAAIEAMQRHNADSLAWSLTAINGRP